MDRHKLVLDENISQTATFVVAGSADAGIVALSLALSPKMKDRGRFVEVSPEDRRVDASCFSQKPPGRIGLY